MNREIKFRAWRHDKQMIYQRDETSASAAEFFNRIWGQDPVMQYTGLKDKNGKEIYEGDVYREELDERPELLTPLK